MEDNLESENFSLYYDTLKEYKSEKKDRQIKRFKSKLKLWYELSTEVQKHHNIIKIADKLFKTEGKRSNLIKKINEMKFTEMELNEIPYNFEFLYEKTLAELLKEINIPTIKEIFTDVIIVIGMILFFLSVWIIL